MMSQDFAPADSFYEPAQDGLVLGVPPLLLAFLLILLLAAGLLGWWLGQKPRNAAGHDGPAIWKAVDEAIRATMTAHSNSLVDRAHDLQRVIQNRLGKTLALGAGFAPLAALDEALADPAGDHGHGHDHGHGPDHGGSHDKHDAHADDAHADKTDLTAARGIVIERASHVVIHQPPRRPTPARPTTPSTPAPPPTEAQRRDAIRKAVSDLNDHWRLKEARIDEIAAAHRELSAR